jgi:hypothetical protein
MHVVRAQSKLKPLQLAGLAAMLAGVALGENAQPVAQMAPYILTGIANTYSVSYEKEADAAAILMLKQTKYNPSAMVSFMEKLRDEERRRPEVDLGIYQTHPATPERVQAALSALAAQGIPYRPRDVAGARQAVVVEPKDKTDVAAVQFGNVTLLQLASLPTGTPVTPVVATTPPATATTDDTSTQALPPVSTSSARARAEAVATRINELLRTNLRWHEITVSGDESGANLKARETVIARVTIADARLENTTPLALAQKWKNNFGRLFWNETINGKL